MQEVQSGLFTTTSALYSKDHPLTAYWTYRQSVVTSVPNYCTNPYLMGQRAHSKLEDWQDILFLACGNLKDQVPRVRLELTTSAYLKRV